MPTTPPHHALPRRQKICAQPAKRRCAAYAPNRRAPRCAHLTPPRSSQCHRETRNHEMCAAQVLRRVQVRVSGWLEGCLVAEGQGFSRRPGLNRSGRASATAPSAQQHTNNKRVRVSVWRQHQHPASPGRSVPASVPSSSGSRSVPAFSVQCQWPSVSGSTASEVSVQSAPAFKATSVQRPASTSVQRQRPSGSRLKGQQSAASGVIMSRSEGSAHQCQYWGNQAVSAVSG
jgi:hypothetical protein